MKFILSLLLSFGASATSFAEMKTISNNNFELKWIGKKVAISSNHYGSIDLKKGSLTLDKGVVTGGSFVVDMTTIKVEDIKDAKYNKKLVSHLESDDFFSIKTHPEAKIVFTKVTKVSYDKYNIDAKLTIKNITKTINFDLEHEKDKYEADIKFDRTQFNVKYGSGNFFKSLGDKVISDEVEVEVEFKI